MYLVAYYRGDTVIRDFLDHYRGQLIVSVVTLGELFYGARNKSDLAHIRKHLSQFEIVPLNEAISTAFVDLLEAYTLSHRPRVPDGLIAATALVHNLELYTLNVKDFRFIPGLRLFRPE